MARKALRITAKPPKGFRRAGFSFGPKPLDIPVESLSPKQLQALKVEEMLIVKEVTLDSDEPKRTKK